MIVQPDVYGDFWASLPGEDEFRVASDLMVGGHLTTDNYYRVMMSGTSFSV